MRGHLSESGSWVVAWRCELLCVLVYTRQDACVPHEICESVWCVALTWYSGVCQVLASVKRVVHCANSPAMTVNFIH